MGSGSMYGPTVFIWINVVCDSGAQKGVEPGSCTERGQLRFPLVRYQFREVLVASRSNQ